MKIFKWKTGRLYSTAGQRIAAVQLDNGHYLFNDIDRGIDGMTKHKNVLDCHPGDAKRFVMDEYDNGNYVAVPAELRQFVVFNLYSAAKEL
jgi:hypothetical protein